MQVPLEICGISGAPSPADWLPQTSTCPWGSQPAGDRGRTGATNPAHRHFTDDGCAL